MGTLKDIKKYMKDDPQLRPMLARSTRRELLIDVDGDGIPDIGLMDYNHDGDIDMIAVDATGNGDFNLYVGDVDANGLIDTVELFDDDDEMPVAAYFGRVVEERFLELAEGIYARIVAAAIAADDLIAAFREFEAFAVEEYEKAKAEEEKAEAEKPEAEAEEPEAEAKEPEAEAEEPEAEDKQKN